MGRCDDEITSAPARWAFNEEVAKTFDIHVRKSIPFYEEVQGQILELADWYLYENSVAYDVGCSTGTTIKLLADKNRDKHVRFVGIDNSRDMLEKARVKLAGVPDVHLKLADVNEDFTVPDASLVTMLFTLQFARKNRRREIIRTIRDGLEEGGALVLVEKILGRTPTYNSMFIELYHDSKLRGGLKEEEIIAKDLSLRGILQPYSLEKNLELLKDFSEVEVFFKWYNWAGMVATK